MSSPSPTSPSSLPLRRALRRVLPITLRRRLKGVVARPRAPRPTRQREVPSETWPRPPATVPPRIVAMPQRRHLRPSEPAGYRRVHVGSGPHHLRETWWNIDIRPFAGLDEVVDAAGPWPWQGLEHVYGEHFLEHLTFDQALAFLGRAAEALAPGGRIRLSTPGLEWVWRTKFDPRLPQDAAVLATYQANLAFHGWGHEFLYSRPMLERVLGGAGFTDIRFHDFGESEDPVFRGLEQHGTPEVVDGWPSVWNVEGTVDPAATPSHELAREAELEFVRHVRAGH